MTNRADRRSPGARVGKKPAVETRPRNAGRRLFVLLAVAALIVLSVASFSMAAGGSTASPAPSASPTASA